MNTEPQEAALTALNKLGPGPFLDMRNACLEGRGTLPPSVRAVLTKHGLDFTEEAIHQYSTAVTSHGYTDTIIHWARAKEPVKEFLCVTLPPKKGSRRNRDVHISMSAVLSHGDVIWLDRDDAATGTITSATCKNEVAPLPSTDVALESMTNDDIVPLTGGACTDDTEDSLDAMNLFARVQKMLGENTEYREEMVHTEKIGKCTRKTVGSPTSNESNFPDSVFMYNKSKVATKYKHDISGKVDAFLGAMKNALFKEHGISVFLDADLSDSMEKVTTTSAEVWVHPNAPIRPGLHGTASVKYDKSAFASVILFNEAVHRAGMMFETAKYIATENFTGDFVELIRIIQ